MTYFIIDNLEEAFPLIDFTNFTDFELFISKFIVNLFIYVFIFIIISIAFKIIVRLVK